MSSAAPTTTTTFSSSSSSLDQQLIAAVRDDKGYDHIKSLIIRKPGGARVNARNSNRNTALHYAARYGQSSTAQLLLQQGAFVNVKNSNGWTPLHEASNNGFEKVARLLLEHGAEANTKGMGGYTPLHESAIKGHANLCYLLMDHGANAHAKNEQGKTVYNVASRGLTSMDLHLYKALEPTRRQIKELTTTCQLQEKELTALKDTMTRQRKAHFETLRRETHQVQTLLEQRLQQQDEEHQAQLAALRLEFTMQLHQVTSQAGSSSPPSRPQNQRQELVESSSSSSGGDGGGPSLLSNQAPQQQQQQQPAPVVQAELLDDNEESSPEKSDDSALVETGEGESSLVLAGNSSSTSKNDLNATAKNMDQPEKSLQKSAGTTSTTTTTTTTTLASSTAPAPAAATAPGTPPSNNHDDTTSLALRRLVLQRNKDMETLRQEIQDTRSSLKKLVQKQDEKVVAFLQQQQQQSINSSNSSSISSEGGVAEGTTSTANGTTTTTTTTTTVGDDEGEVMGQQQQQPSDTINIQKLLDQQEAKQKADMAALQDQLVLKQKSEIKSIREELARSLQCDSSVRQDVEALRDEFHSNMQHIQAEMATVKDWKKEATTARGSSASASAAADLGARNSRGDDGDESHLQQLARKKGEKEAAALSAMKDALLSKHQADVETLRGEINAAQENLFSLIQQQNEAASKNKIAQSQSGDDTTNNTEDDMTCHGEEDYVTHAQLKKFLHKKTNKQEAKLDSLSEEFQSLMEFLEEADVGTIRDDLQSTQDNMAELIATQMEEQHAAVAELRDAVNRQQKTLKKALPAAVAEAQRADAQQSRAVSPCGDSSSNDILTLEDLKRTVKTQGEVQRTALTALRDKLALQRNNDMIALREENATTKAHLEQLGQQQDAVMAALRDEGTANSKEKKGKSMVPGDSLVSIQKQQEEQLADISMLKTEIVATKASLEKLSDQQQSSLSHESRMVGKASVGKEDSKEYQDLKKLMEKHDEEHRAAITTLRKDMSSTKETSQSSDDSLKLIQKQQEELRAQQKSDMANLQEEFNSTKESLEKLNDLHMANPASAEPLSHSIEQLVEKQKSDLASLEEKFMDKESVVELIQQGHDEQQSQRVNEEQDDELRAEIGDLREMVSSYLIALKDTLNELAALRENLDENVPNEVGESVDTSSKDSEMQEELGRMFDEMSEGSRNEEEVTLQEELQKVRAELKLVQAMADRYKDTVMKLHQISEQALS